MRKHLHHVPLEHHNSLSDHLVGIASEGWKWENGEHMASLHGSIDQLETGANACDQREGVRPASLLW